MKLWILQSWVWLYKAPLDALQRFKLCTTCPHWHGSHQACSEPWHPGWPFPAAPRLKTCMCLVHRYLHLSSLLQQPRPRNKPRWVKKHFLKMKSLKAPLCMLIFHQLSVITIPKPWQLWFRWREIHWGNAGLSGSILDHSGCNMSNPWHATTSWYYFILLWHHDQSISNDQLRLVISWQRPTLRAPAIWVSRSTAWATMCTMRLV